MEVTTTDTIKPPYRLELKSRLVLAGYLRDTQFAKALGCDPARVSRILNSWEYPGPKMQKRMASVLGCTLKELRELL
jgi:transcriptional regulator with XRE-family HTH domain